MNRKSISTNAAVVTCDVCGRTLLRGEIADVFLARRRSGATSASCAPARAVHEGWIREGLDDVLARSRDGRSRSRSLLGRLRSAPRAEAGAEVDEPPARARRTREPAEPSTTPPVDERAGAEVRRARRPSRRRARAGARPPPAAEAPDHGLYARARCTACRRTPT